MLNRNRIELTGNIVKPPQSARAGKAIVVADDRDAAFLGREHVDREVVGGAVSQPSVGRSR